MSGMRRPVAMTEDANGGWTVVCDDGTVWFSTHDRVKDPDAPFGEVGYTNHRWEQAQHGPIPGSRADHEALAKAHRERSTTAATA